MPRAVTVPADSSVPAAPGERPACQGGVAPGAGELRAYYRNLRHEILDKVPASAKRVLTVGCGAGVTEQELVRRGVQVVGIELDPVAAAAARAGGLEMIPGDASQDHPLLDAGFDGLIYADVLEHIADPQAILRKHVAHLRPGGFCIVSVPNFRNVRVGWQLFVQGHVRYQDHGIFDRTHLRLTTRKLVEAWLTGVGMTLTGREYRLFHRRDRWADIATLTLAREWIAQQVIVTATAPPDFAGRV